MKESEESLFYDLQRGVSDFLEENSTIVGPVFNRLVLGSCEVSDRAGLNTWQNNEACRAVFDSVCEHDPEYFDMPCVPSTANAGQRER